MADSILTSTKATLGLPEEHTAFDTELIIFINSVLSRLTQLGAGPVEGFRISDKEATWEDFIGPGPKLNNVMGYMSQRVKLFFDPPEVGFVLTAMKENIKEEEWRIMVECDPIPVTTPVVVSPAEVILDGGEI